MTVVQLTCGWADGSLNIANLVFSDQACVPSSNIGVSHNSRPFTRSYTLSHTITSRLLVVHAFVSFLVVLFRFQPFPWAERVLLVDRRRMRSSRAELVAIPQSKRRMNFAVSRSLPVTMRINLSDRNFREFHLRCGSCAPGMDRLPYPDTRLLRSASQHIP